MACTHECVAPCSTASCGTPPACAFVTFLSCFGHCDGRYATVQEGFLDDASKVLSQGDPVTVWVRDTRSDGKIRLTLLPPGSNAKRSTRSGNTSGTAPTPMPRLETDQLSADQWVDGVVVGSPPNSPFLQGMFSAGHSAKAICQSKILKAGHGLTQDRHLGFQSTKMLMPRHM